jgi:hypothetical protein
LRGDLPNIDEKWQVEEGKFNYAYDMVKHIRYTTRIMIGIININIYNQCISVKMCRASDIGSLTNFLFKKPSILLVPKWENFIAEFTLAKDIKIVELKIKNSSTFGPDFRQRIAKKS